MSANHPQDEFDQQTIFTDFGTSVSRLDWMKTIEDVHERAAAQEGMVHVIHDFRSVNYRMMTTSLRHAVQIAKSIPSNVATYIVLTENRLIEFVGTTVKRLVPTASQKIHFAPSLDVVRAIIERYEQNNV